VTEALSHLLWGNSCLFIDTCRSSSNALPCNSPLCYVCYCGVFHGHLRSRTGVYWMSSWQMYPTAWYSW